MIDVFKELPIGARRFGAGHQGRQALHGVFAQLSTEHLEALTLIKKLSNATTPDERRKWWARVQTVLVAHERAELQEVYNEFEAYPSLRVIIDDHAHQAHRLESLVAELNSLQFDNSDWPLVLRRLEASVRQHVVEEETEFFPRAQDAIGDQKAKELTIPYLTAKRSFVLP